MSPFLTPDCPQPYPVPSPGIFSADSLQYFTFLQNTLTRIMYDQHETDISEPENPMEVFMGAMINNVIAAYCAYYCIRRQT
jgi:uncharacterized membrane protein SpoIIM required for sporulation